MSNSITIESQHEEDGEEGLGFWVLLGSSWIGFPGGPY